MKTLIIILSIILPSLVIQAQQASFSASRTSTCPGFPINFTDNSTGATSWAYTFTGANIGFSNDTSPANIIFLTPGKFDIILRINGNPNLQDTVTMNVIQCRVSSGIYRIPYVDGTKVKVSRDHLTHTPSPVRIDMGGRGGGLYAIAAAADGVIRWIDDSNLECCNSVGGCSDCNNYVWIEHPNGEWTKYTHFRTGTVTGAGFANLSKGDTVCAGTFLGFEGDVGASSGGGRAASSCSGDISVQNDIDSINGARIANMQDSLRCGQHLHFEVAIPTDSTDPFQVDGGFVKGINVIPLFCDIPGNIFFSGDTFTAGPCQGNTCIDTLMLNNWDLSLPDVALSQASKVIIAENNYNVKSGASVMISAGKKIHLKPGFVARTNSYFRARIGKCNSSPGSINCSSKSEYIASKPKESTEASFFVYPNPFTSEVNMNFKVKEDMPVSVAMHNIQGREIMKLIDGRTYTAGSEHNVSFDTDRLPAGAYVITFTCGNTNEVKKLIKVQ